MAPCGGCGKRAKANKKRKAVTPKTNTRKTTYNQQMRDYAANLRRKK